MLIRALKLPVAVAAFAFAAIAAAPAQAAEVHAPPATLSAPQFFTATLNGANEVPASDGTGVAVGDPIGSATALIEIEGTKVTYALRWRGMAAPTMGHIHAGRAWKNGDAKVALFETPLPDTSTAAAGTVWVHDPRLVTSIRQHPSRFYLNLHSSAFPDGAVRGQLVPSGKGNPLALLKGMPLRAFLNGGHEVPVTTGPAVGDLDGNGIASIRATGHHVKYAYAWYGIEPPTEGHIHRAAVGVDGPVVISLFTTPVPDGVFAIAGRVRAEPRLVRAIKTTPSEFYTNLHNVEFPGGAIRGQLDVK